MTYVTDADGKVKKYTYNALGKVSKVTEPDSQGNLTVDTTYAYDKAWTPIIHSPPDLGLQPGPRGRAI